MKFPTYEEMAKDVAQKAMDDFLFNGKSIREWAKLIIDLGIPENPTNGDLLLSIFQEKSDCFYPVGTDKMGFAVDVEWWNAPWKGQQNED